LIFSSDTTRCTSDRRGGGRKRKKKKRSERDEAEEGKRSRRPSSDRAALLIVLPGCPGRLWAERKKEKEIFPVDGLWRKKGKKCRPGSDDFLYSSSIFDQGGVSVKGKREEKHPDSWGSANSLSLHAHLIRWTPKRGEKKMNFLGGGREKKKFQEAGPGLTIITSEDAAKKKRGESGRRSGKLSTSFDEKPIRKRGEMVGQGQKKRRLWGSEVFAFILSY